MNSDTPSLKAFGYADSREVLDAVLNPAHRISFVRILFPDILGRPMDFAFPVAELESAFRDGKGFDGSSVEGFVRIEESDLVIKPDPATFRVLPWTYRGFAEDAVWREAVMFGDILTPEGKPYEGDSRHVLRLVLDKARREFGVDDVKCGPELEFFLFPDDRTPRPMDAGGYFFAGRHGEVRKEIQLLLHRMGIATEYDHHEVAHGQHEIDLAYRSALEMADTAMIFRYMVKKVARMHGLYATFMPKPINGQNGSGMHVHQSLWRDGKNLFFDPDAPYRLSETARGYMAGLIAHARDISAVCSQWVNSYKRLIEGYEAPVYIAWGQRNRSAYIRVPEYQPGKEQATRIELRSPDPACNVHLAFATMFAAGLAGIRVGERLPDPVEENIYRMSNARQRKFEIRTLPRNLEEAVRIMEKSDLVRETLGEGLSGRFLANKRRELEDYAANVPGELDKQVSDYEVRTYLPVL
ncbi:MAG: glutamine synthetase [Candidatus Aminicenantes bacterium]|nr:glutamine synthetase [Candidatus Aminicenantes bacterium]